MELRDRVAIVTGGASGIGREICLAFARAGARGVVVADLDEPGAAAVAAEVTALGSTGIGQRVDVSVEADVTALVEATENELGPVDVFVANAGLLLVGGIDASDEIWERAWTVNVKSHLYAARAVIPSMVARGEGYLVHTASAAGLLTQLGAAPYSVSKHAVVAFAEWLSIAYGDAGVRVSALCPQAVATNLGATSTAILSGRDPVSPQSGSDGDASSAGDPGGVPRGSLTGAAGAGASQAAHDGVLSATSVADLVVEAMGDERFLILPHPEVATYEQRRAGDRDRWLKGMRRMQAQMMNAAAWDEPAS
ncbi:MAG: SDR family oxidoreductase [Acidimicrobiales bacterium]